MLGISASAFAIFEGLMFYLIHIERADLNINLHYTSIIAAAVFSLLTLIIELATAKSENESIRGILLGMKNGNLLRIAMLFTLVADYFLVAKVPQDHLMGVAFFLGTQLFIFLHIIVNDNSKKARLIHTIFRIALIGILICVAFLVLRENADLLALISVIYYANLCINAIFAHRIGRGGIILTVGLILFALCDINVGLSALNNMYEGGFAEGSFLYNLLHSEYDLIWIFYIPSQTLISLSLLRHKDNG